MAKPSRRQVQAGLAIRKGADDPSSLPDLAHDPLQRIVGPQLDPVTIRKAIIGQRLAHVSFHQAITHPLFRTEVQADTV